MFKIYFFLNIVLYPLEILLEPFYKKNVNKNCKIIVIFGNYASSTTLIMQILVTNVKVNYINNVSSKFFLCPALGQFLNKLIFLLFKPKSNYYSNDGITKGFLEPSEFGWFWRNFFWEEKKLNLKKFEKMIKIFTKNKNNNFLFKYCMHEKNRSLLENYKYFKYFKKNLIFIYPFRKKNLVVNSILNRKKNLNNHKSSYKLNLKIKDIKKSVKNQVDEIYKEHEIFLKKFDKSQIYKISFEKFKKNRNLEIKKLSKFLNKHNNKTIDWINVKKNLSKITFKPEIKKI